MILGQLNSKHIVQYIDSFVHGNKVNIIMEYCEYGDLFTYLKNKASQGLNSLSESSIWKYLIQLCLGINYLHNEKKILHRDLKTLNIFLCKDGSIKIGDLGVARKLVEASNMLSGKKNSARLLETEDIYSAGIEQTTQVGTPYYIAPEIWEGK